MSVNFKWVRALLGSIVFCSAVEGAAKCSTALDKVQSSGKPVYACQLATEKMKFCTSSSTGCYKVNFSSAEKTLKDKLKSQSGYANRKALRFLKRASEKNKGVLLGYLDLMKWRKKIRVKTDFLVQTGPYGKIHITDKPTSVRCLKEIMHSAYLLETHFPEYSFQIDGDIKSCSNLKAGIVDLVTNKRRVKKNIAKFHSPMHTVYLTTQTKFNHFVVGKMGLYINVNRSNEIPKRLINFLVGTNQIAHETKSL